MEVLGNCGRSGRDYTGAESVIDGRRASEYEPKVYPDDYCTKCAIEGRGDDEQCFHKHWQGGKE